MNITGFIKRISSRIKARRAYKKERKRANSNSRLNYYLHKNTKLNKFKVKKRIT